MDPVVETKIFETACDEYYKNYVDVKRFEECCAACAGWSGTWACPPYDFDPEDIWHSFKTILLYAKKVFVPNELAEKTYKGNELFEAYEALLKPVKRKMLSELFEMEALFPGSMLLSAGGCDFCETCTRPAGESCRLPHKLRYSVESIGGNVLKSIEDFFGEKILWAENGRLPEYYILLGALLKK